MQLKVEKEHGLHQKVICHSLLGKTLNSEILKNSSGRVRVTKKNSGRLAGTRQALVSGLDGTFEAKNKT